MSPISVAIFRLREDGLYRLCRAIIDNDYFVDLIA